MAVQELEKTKAMLIQQGKVVQAEDIQHAIDDIRQGAGVEKTLVIYWMYDTMPVTQPDVWVAPPFG